MKLWVQGLRFRDSGSGLRPFYSGSGLRPSPHPTRPRPCAASRRTTGRAPMLPRHAGCAASEGGGATRQGTLAASSQSPPPPTSPESVSAQPCAGAQRGHIPLPREERTAFQDFQPQANAILVPAVSYVPNLPDSGAGRDHTDGASTRATPPTRVWRLRREALGPLFS